jgi:hypothetical protein
VLLASFLSQPGAALPSAVDLKFLSVVRRVRIGTSNPKPH